MHLYTTTQVVVVVVWVHFQPQLLKMTIIYTTTFIVRRVDLTSRILPPVGTVHEVETNDYWILVESWSKSYYLLQILSHALAMEFSPITTH